MVSLTIQPRGSGKPRWTVKIDISDSSNVAAIKKAFQTQKPKYYPTRQRLTLDSGKVLNDEQSVKELGLKNGDIILFKDLGTQIGYQTVFLVEYFGPLVIFPMLYFGRQYFYSADDVARARPYHLSQELALYCWTFHYAKREAETLLVHRFSHATMPIFNLFKNSMYYWGFAFMVAYFVCHPLYTPPSFSDETLYTLAAGFFAMAIGNGITHIMLRNLRPAGSKVRKIPTGFLFELVSCPNYTFEIATWVFFSIFTQTLLSWIFTFVGAMQMTIWAIGKHKRYRKEFDGKEGRELYPRSRRIVIPFLY